LDDIMVNRSTPIFLIAIVSSFAALTPMDEVAHFLSLSPTDFLSYALATALMVP
jgi:hypothetical protein